MEVKKVDHVTRLVINNGGEIYERLLEVKETETLCQHTYSVEVKKASTPENQIFFDNCKVTNSVKFEKDGEGTKFTMYSIYTGPYNLIKAKRSYFDAIYSTPYYKHLNS